MSGTGDTLSKNHDDGKASPEKKRYDRYPGLRSFEDNEVDQRLFVGREQEIDVLLHRVRASRLLVLFGKSGLGKTSLLQAGLYARLRERKLLPVPVRLNQPGVSPVRAVFDALRVTCEKHEVEYEPQAAEGLWEFFKDTDLWHGEVLLTPVLVFDQFEELFTLQFHEVRVALATALGELASRGVPTRIRQRLQSGGRADYSDTPPEVKIILSLREEYVGALEQLVPEVPTIFEQRFRLASLTRDVARRAVVEPAAFDDPAVFATQPFRYAPSTLEAIMEFLANRQEEVEPVQLQIVCQHVEQQVASRQEEGKFAGEVNETIVGGREGMEALLQNFYRTAIRNLPGIWLRGVLSSSERSRARRLCENGLLSQAGHRISMEQGQVREQYHVSDDSLERLTKARLLRKEHRPGLEGFYYELSHDSLTAPVMKSRQSRRRKSTFVFSFIGAAYLLLLVASMIETGQLQRTILRLQSIIVNIHIEPAMIPIPGGTFPQGDVEAIGEVGHRPVRNVIINPFNMGKYEVTFEEYDRFVIATDRDSLRKRDLGRGKLPVSNVSWQDAKDYAAWLSKASDSRFRLPTEAEWEYAARSGGKQDIWAGTSDENELADYAVFGRKDGIDRVEHVGTKKGNDLGLYDMSGNVWEWVEDCAPDASEGVSQDGSALLDADCDMRVVRGGSWSSDPKSLRTTTRARYSPDKHNPALGFRLAEDIS